MRAGFSVAIHALIQLSITHDALYHLPSVTIWRYCDREYFTVSLKFTPEIRYRLRNDLLRLQIFQLEFS